MAFIDPALIQGAALLARQATTSAVTSALTSASAAPSTVSPVPSSATPTPSPTDSQQPTTPGGGGAGSGGNNSQSSPLLFFVALGFGVVFTNLWIIVGVKYCFRYNARSRQMRLAEDGEPITMENMPRPHRRRREKKLMTMEEVNEKFPMLKYKNWVATRVKEGLPARGGVSAPPSRANSVRSVEGIAPEIPSKETPATDAPPATPKEKTDLSPPPKDASSSTPDTAPAGEGQASTSVPSAAPTTIAPPRASDEHTEDEEDDEHINAAIPPECMGTTGDTCAICIDTIEDDDDVRGLTCGHAFHAVCLDPWLTSRRACCPLCKADYYTPKPRPPPPEGAEANYVTVTVAGDGRQRMNMPSRPQGTWISMRGAGRMFPVRFVIRGGDHVIDQSSNADAAAAAAASRRRPGWFSRSGSRPETSSRAPASSQAAAATAGSNEHRGNWLGNVRAGLPTLRNPLRRQNDQVQAQPDQPLASGANPAASPVSPSQLEAGVRT